MASQWLLCSYRLPREPSKLRLAIWRRLRRIGAVILHDSLWTLPADPQTRESFEWLAEEIEERGGTVLLWEARGFSSAQDKAVAETFRAEAAERYAEMALAARQLAGVVARRGKRPRPAELALQRLRQLERALRQERRRDYFKASGRGEAEAAIRASIGLVGAKLAAGSTERRRHAVGD